MADEQGLGPAQTGTDRVPNEIASSFSSRFPDFRCVVCGAEEFEILNGSGDDYISDYIVHRNVQRRGTASIETIGIACTNCGHIHQFALDVLRRRLSGS